MNRQQRVKLSRDCSSEWGHVPADVPQGTKLGPCLFLLMINNLKVSDESSWKYVDNTSVAEVMPSKSAAKSNAQLMRSNPDHSIINSNLMLINAKKLLSI